MDNKDELLEHCANPTAKRNAFHEKFIERITCKDQLTDENENTLKSRITRFGLLSAAPVNFLQELEGLRRRRVGVNSAELLLLPYSSICASDKNVIATSDISCCVTDLNDKILNENAPFVVIQRILQQITAGLEYLHSLNIVHGDLNPKTVFITSSGRPRLANWGLVPALHSHHLVPPVSERGVTHATWACRFYAAPEVLTMHTPLTPAADVFSLGVLLASCFQKNMVPLPDGTLLAAHSTRYGKPCALAECAVLESEDILRRNCPNSTLRQMASACLSLQSWDRPSASSVSSNMGRPSSMPGNLWSVLRENVKGTD